MDSQDKEFVLSKQRKKSIIRNQINAIFEVLLKTSSWSDQMLETYRVRLDSAMFSYPEDIYDLVRLYFETRSKIVALDSMIELEAVSCNYVEYKRIFLEGRSAELVRLAKVSSDNANKTIDELTSYALKQSSEEFSKLDTFAYKFIREILLTKEAQKRQQKNQSPKNAYSKLDEALSEYQRTGIETEKLRSLLFKEIEEIQRVKFGSGFSALEIMQMNAQQRIEHLNTLMEQPSQEELIDLNFRYYNKNQDDQHSHDYASSDDEFLTPDDYERYGYNKRI